MLRRVPPVYRPGPGSRGPPGGGQFRNCDSWPVGLQEEYHVPKKIRKNGGQSLSLQEEYPTTIGWIGQNKLKHLAPDTARSLQFFSPSQKHLYKFTTRPLCFKLSFRACLNRDLIFCDL
jgi:hypothetical protein